MHADKSSPFQMVQSLASQLQEVPAEDVLLSLHHVPQVFHHTPFTLVVHAKQSDATLQPLYQEFWMDVQNSCGKARLSPGLVSCRSSTRAP